MVNALKSHRTALACAVAALAMIPAAIGIQALAHVSDKGAVHTTFDGRSDTKRIALVIANTDYPDADVPLARTNIDDVQTLADSLRQRGFEVDVEENVTKAAMGQAVDALVAKAKPGVTALVAFSGYGIQVDRENYLIPVDSHIWKGRDVARDGFSLSSVLGRLTAKGADHTVAILDASRRNPFERRFRSRSEGLAAVDPPRATIVLSTTGPGRTSDDLGANARPIRAVSEEMNSQPGDAESLFNAAKRSISVASKGRQVPSVSSALSDSFAF